MRRRLTLAAALRDNEIARTRADVAELADAHGSGPCTRKGVKVQVLSSAPITMWHSAASPQVVLIMWGRLVTCGGLVIRLSCARKISGRLPILIANRPQV